MQNQKQKLIPLSQWNKYYDFPTVGSLRQYIFHNTDNFKNEVIKRIGKGRLYIDVDAFFAWVDKTSKAV